MDVILIKDGEVKNVILADSLERAAQFYPGYILRERTPQLSAVTLGYTFQNGNFVPPEFWDTVNPEKIITPYAFLRRFTTEESIAIDLASLGATNEAAGLRRFFNLINRATQVDLTDQLLCSSIAQMVSAGLLTQNRATAILEGIINEDERP
jgi:hypothetical protein